MNKRKPVREIAYHFLVDYLNNRDNLNFTCFYCGCDLSETKMAIDHMNPPSRGGSDKVANLVLCCKSCNSAKSDMKAYEFMGISHPKFVEVFAKEIMRESIRRLMRDTETISMIAEAQRMYQAGLITDADIARVFSQPLLISSDKAVGGNSEYARGV